MERSFLDRGDAVVLDDMKHVCEECAKNLNTWKVPAANLEKMSVLVENAQIAFEANKAKATKSAKTKAAKDIAFREMKAYAREFNSDLKFNLNIPNEMLIAMGLPSREHTNFPKPPPSSPFNLKLKKDKTKVKASGSRVIEDQPLKTKRPKDATGGMRLEHYLKSRGIATVERIETSKSSHVFNLPPETRGDTLVVRGQWIDAKYRGGPWSDWVEIFLG